MLNNTRLQIILKGFANTTDIKAFVPCVHKKAQEIYADIETQVKAENKSMHPSGVNPKRLIEYIGMEESDIIRYAELEKKLGYDKNLKGGSQRCKKT